MGKYPAIPATDRNIKALLKSMNDFGYKVDYDFVKKVVEDLKAGVEREDVVAMFIERQMEDAQKELG